MQTHTKLFYLIEAEGTEREKKEINQGDVQMEAAKPRRFTMPALAQGCLRWPGAG